LGFDIYEEKIVSNSMMVVEGIARAIAFNLLKEINSLSITDIKND